MKKFNVLIVGAGQIGAFYDTPRSRGILTHAHAFTTHKGFRLVGFVDLNIKKAKQAALIWKCQFFSSIEEALKRENIDVLVVATPDESHYKVLKKVARFPLKLIVAEKPLVTKIEEAQEILSIYRKNNLPIAVNYIRRFIPELELLRRKIVKGQYGNFITGNSYYGKGLIHNGSHNIDLIRWLIGEIDKAVILDGEADYDKNDWSISAILTLSNNRKVHLQYVSCKLFTIFENNFIFEKGRINIRNGSKVIEEYLIKKNKTFKDCRNLIKVSSIVTKKPAAQYFLAKNIYNFLIKKAPLKCDLIEGYKTLQACLLIKQSHRKI